MPRPRIHPDATTRVAARRAATTAAGGRRLELLLPPSGAADLATAMSDGRTALSAVLAGLAGEAKKIRRAAKKVMVAG